jgi:predicted RNA binding protein YcfA (HicA-like mRNA interferase family)
MGKLRVFSGAQLIQLLEQNEFEQLRQRGSHVLLQRRTDTETWTVPVPLYRELKTGTVASIIRQSGLSRELFEID